MNNMIRVTATVWNAAERMPVNQDLVAEEPLSIRVQGHPYAVVMRTPGDEPAHAAGFCLAEGIVDVPGDIASLAFCDGDDTNVVTVTLSPARKADISDILDRRGYISQTGCGLCGKQIVDDLYQALRPFTGDVRLDVQKAYQCLDTLSVHQPLREKTRAAHAAVVYSADWKRLSAAEDVGRHNALDKAVGRLFLDGTLAQAAFLTLSSRISYELVQKAARARIPVVFAVSRPTSLAVELAKRLNMTLACFAGRKGLTVFCGRQRLAGL